MKRESRYLLLVVMLISLVSQTILVGLSAEGPKYTKKNISGNQFKGFYDINDGITQYSFANRMVFNFSSDSNVSLDVTLDTQLSDYYFSVSTERLQSSPSMPVYTMNSVKEYGHPAQGKAGRWGNSQRYGPHSSQNPNSQENPTETDLYSISPYRQIYFIVEVQNIQEINYSIYLDTSITESLGWAYYNLQSGAWYLLDSQIVDGWLITSINSVEDSVIFSADQIIVAPVQIEPETSPIIRFLKENWAYLLIGAVALVFILLMSSQQYRDYLLNRLPIVNKGVHRHLEMEDVLENEVRSKIIDVILDNPGIHFNELMRFLDISAGQLAWHLDVLETFHVIRKMRVGQYLTYFPYLEHNPISKIDLHLSKSKTTLEILQIINDNPGIYQRQIAKRLDLNHKTVKYHIDKLIEVGAIKIEESNSKKGLYPTLSQKASEE